MHKIITTLVEIRDLLRAQHILHKTFLTTEEAATYLGLSVSQVHKLSASRTLKHYSPGGKLNYFNRTDLDNWLASNPKPAIEQPPIRSPLKKGGRMM